MTERQVTEAERAVLEFLWEHGSATKRQIAAELYPGESASDMATVQKLLERLEAKAYVRRDRSSFAHVISPAVSRDEFVGRQLEAVAEKLSAGSLTPLLIQLVGSQRLTKKERDTIRQLLDDADQRASSRRSPNRRKRS